MFILNLLYSVHCSSLQRPFAVALLHYLSALLSILLPLLLSKIQAVFIAQLTAPFLLPLVTRALLDHLNVPIIFALAHVITVNLAVNRSRATLFVDESLHVIQLFI
jgi:hypothetical protein